MPTQFMGETTSLPTIVSLLTQSRFLVQADDAGDLEVETSDTNVTFSVPPEAIAEYIPTVTVNVPGARHVPLSPTPICESLRNTLVSLLLLHILA